MYTDRNKADVVCSSASSCAHLNRPAPACVCVCACAYVCVGGYRGQPLIRTITLRQKLSTASVFFSSTLYDTHACTHRHTRTHARTHTQTHTHTHTHTQLISVCSVCVAQAEGRPETQVTGLTLEHINTLRTLSAQFQCHHV